jgi:putative glutamine amidotransferase
MTRSPTGRPVIGITAHREMARWAFWQRDTDLLTAVYADSIAAAGGCPVLLPARPDVPPDAVGRLDALVLSGGPDVDPTRYGEVAHPQTLAAHPDRDAAELAVLAAAVQARVPVLAVCRGVQLVNVWCGGSLLQHIYDAPGRLHHGEGGKFTTRTVSVAEGSWLAGVMGPEAKVPCHHHQAVDRVGEGLQAVAWAEDGTVEALELNRPGVLVVGIQWHPEEDGSSMLFDALIHQAARTRSRRGGPAGGDTARPGV